MADNAHITQEFVSSVIAGEAFADASLLVFRDPSSFRAGELHRHMDQWDKLFQSSDNNFSEFLDWIHNYVRVDKFFAHYKGSYKRFNYKCDRPPARIFAHHLSCKAFAQFISDTLIERLASGAISLWGKVGECPPPHLVMPLTVETFKPCLCNDNRFLNLWIQDRPFSLDSVQHLPKYVLSNFFQTVCDDNSLVTALKCLVKTTLNLNIDLHVHYVAGTENPADSPSCRLSLQDSKLGPSTWALVQNLYGGPKGHFIDLMARASNVQTDLSDNPLPFFLKVP